MNTKLVEYLITNFPDIGRSKKSLIFDKNQKAEKLLKDLADLQLISIPDSSEEPFLAVVIRLRKKAATKPPTLENITNEVEAVRTKRYAKNKA